MSDRVAALARRVENDPFFLASALAAYARAEDLDDGGLAARLGCPVERLSAIRLCRTPRGVATAFQRDVDRIASAFQVDGRVIAEAVRRAESVRAFRQIAEERFLMAARDREPDDASAEADESDEAGKS